MHHRTSANEGCTNRAKHGCRTDFTWLGVGGLDAMDGQGLHGAVDSGNCYRYHTIIHLAVVIMNIERNFHDQIIIMSGELVLEDL